MLLFGKSESATKNPSLVLADLQSREDQRDLDHSLKDLTAAEKTHDKSIKAAVNAQRAVDKAIENEYETAKALNRATHNHDVAISNEQNARITAKINQQYEVHLQQGLEQKGRRLDELQQRKVLNEQLRESNLSQVNAQASLAALAVAADARRTDPANAVPAAEPITSAVVAIGAGDAVAAA